jgi:hypothetical protein
MSPRIVDLFFPSDQSGLIRFDLRDVSRDGKVGESDEGEKNPFRFEFLRLLIPLRAKSALSRCFIHRRLICTISLFMIRLYQKPGRNF